MNIPERLPKSIRGLEQMCRYVVGALKLDKGKEECQLTMAEIGVWTGAGTGVFVRYFQKVVVVDPWSSDEPEIAGQYNMAEVEKIFDGRFSGCDRVVKMKARSPEAADAFLDETFDMVYIDAVHALKYVREDISAWWPKVKKGGFLCGHDYSKRFPGVVRAVDDFRSKVKTFQDTSWVVRV